MASFLFKQSRDFFRRLGEIGRDSDVSDIRLGLRHKRSQKRKKTGCKHDVVGIGGDPDGREILVVEDVAGDVDMRSNLRLTSAPGSLLPFTTTQTTTTRC
jgi:hypothetical protein